jgi:hypothetical protein
MYRARNQDLVVVRRKLFDVPDFQNVRWAVFGVEDRFHVRFSCFDRFLFLCRQGVENESSNQQNDEKEAIAKDANFAAAVLSNRR